MDAELTLLELGEDALVARLAALLPTPSADVLAGPGDDCAVVRVPGSERLQLLKVDAVVEGVHFASGEDMERVGWKALCRAVSDVAAMGGEPEHALLALQVPVETPLARLEGLVRGIARAARRFGVSVVGGETGKTSGPLSCTVTLTGWVEPERCVHRSGGRPGDVLLVTGSLGGSLASGKHLDFVPRLEESRWLCEGFRPHALMDLSDGLAADVRRLARASGCGVRLLSEAIPCAPGCSLDAAMGDGEDFELLMAMPGEKVPLLLELWAARFPGLALSVIGALTHPEEGFQPADLFAAGGYDHFK